jgi:prepilin-type N-terminal cleavage/methylation domain-containing protein
MATPPTGAHRPGMRPRRGYTVLEVLVTLSVLSVLLGIALPPLGHWRDRAAVRAARDELAAAFAWTRMAAAAGGGASLVLDPTAGTFRVRAGPGAGARTVDLGRRFGVTVEVGAGAPVVFDYDALGIGRLASRTIVLHRKSASAGIVVSAYGRVRPW